MNRNDFEAAGLILLLGLASGCQTLPEPTATSGTPETTEMVEKAEATETPVADLMYELLQGEMSGFRGDLPAAFEHYYQASLLTDDPQVASRATEIALWMQDPDRVLKAALRWRDLVPKNPHPLRVLGSIHAARGEIPAALEAYRESIEASPLSLELDLLAVSNSLSTPEAQSARLEVLRGLTKIYPKSAHAHLHVAGIARAEEKMDEALAAVRRASELLPQWPEAITLQADILRSMERTEEAVALLREALAQPIQNAQRLRQMMADLLNSLGRQDEARAQFEKLLESDPGNPHWQMTLGSLALLAGDWKEAETHFLALSSNPRPLVSGQPQALNRSVSAYFLGLVAEETKEERKAMDYYYQVEERDYFGVDEYYQKARVRIAHLLLNAGTLEQARMHLKVSRGRSQREESVVQLYVAEGDLLYGLKQYDAGLALLNKALEEYPGQAPLLYSRALLAERLGRIDWLERDLQAVLAEDPENPQALNALGYTWADHNLNLELALEYIERAHAQLPDDAAVTDSLGWVHYRLGNLEKAEALLRRAFSLMTEGEIAAHLVEVLWVRGRHEEARRIYREAIDQLPDDEFLAQVAQRFSL
ncbi:MAG: tetratricopeptide repeat protein [Gammaproteobacteria bacterium]|nr:tetratricopeptide repeat protein [Gammaproteobacteria bacterium]